MANLRIKRKVAGPNKENCKKHPRSNLAQNSNVPRTQEDYSKQVCKEIEDRLTEKFSQQHSRTKNCSLGWLFCVNDFLLSPLIQGLSGSTPETSWNTLRTNQGLNEDDSRSDPEAGVSQSQTTNFGPDGAHDMVTGVHEQILCRHDM